MKPYLMISNNNIQPKSLLITETERLSIRHLTQEDCSFILELLNQQSFIDNIGDRGVKNLEDAIRYIENGPQKSYLEHGYGLNLICLQKSNQPIGICGILKREYFQLPDLGYAILESFAGKGYTYEASCRVLNHAHRQLSLSEICAVTAPHNQASNALLIKLGFVLSKQILFEDQLNNYYIFKSKNSI